MSHLRTVDPVFAERLRGLVLDSRIGCLQHSKSCALKADHLTNVEIICNLLLETAPIVEARELSVKKFCGLARKAALNQSLVEEGVMLVPEHRVPRIYSLHDFDCRRRHEQKFFT